MRRSPMAVVALVALACVAGIAPAQADTRATPAAAPSAAVSARLSVITTDPRVGRCFVRGDMNHWVLTGPKATAVPCTQVHQAMTLGFVDVTSLNLTMSFARAHALQLQVNNYRTRGQVPPAATTRALSRWSASLTPVYAVCQAQLRRAIGVRDLRNGGLRRTLFQIDLTGPSATRWASGDRLARCDVVRYLPLDGSNSGYRMLPLPQQLADAGDAIANQYCWRTERNELVVRLCTHPSFNPVVRGAWLTVYDLIPMPVWNKPATEMGANAQLVSLCRFFMRDRVARSAAPLPASRVKVRVYDKTTLKRTDALTAWGKGQYRYSCSLPSGTYA